MERGMHTVEDRHVSGSGSFHQRARTLVIDVLQESFNLLVKICTKYGTDQLGEIYKPRPILTEPMDGSFLPEVPELASDRRSSGSSWGSGLVGNGVGAALWRPLSLRAGVSALVSAASVRTVEDGKKAEENYSFSRTC
jgi:hypothetical protein